MSRIHDKQQNLRNFAIILVAVFTALLGFGFPEWFGLTTWHWFVGYFVSVNLVTWMFFYYDKRIAGKQGVVRVPENALFLLSVAGGLPSTLIAMRVLKHKRAKASFKWKLFAWFTLVYALVGLSYWFFGDSLEKLSL